MVKVAVIGRREERKESPIRISRLGVAANTVLLQEETCPFRKG